MSSSSWPFEHTTLVGNRNKINLIVLTFTRRSTLCSTLPSVRFCLVKWLLRNKTLMFYGSHHQVRYCALINKGINQTHTGQKSALNPSYRFFHLLSLWHVRCSLFIQVSSWICAALTIKHSSISSSPTKQHKSRIDYRIDGGGGCYGSRV